MEYFSDGGDVWIGGMFVVPVGRELNVFRIWLETETVHVTTSMSKDLQGLLDEGTGQERTFHRKEFHISGQMCKIVQERVCNLGIQNYQVLWAPELWEGMRPGRSGRGE